eukprot:CAMPEP_0182866852 /NCGR_PEP_ID=MMETSP0034_2-20130328/8415_1 /TAXON_ID=156128 /ORGANISM="Nephroselmis pyriformis, Strain CCMP717" /LENGTH=366 /DNA_ID=CAMNT_0024999185 /DNA_START=25 /DNA_END=1121 /DNA_ORIENTATION=-
MSACLAARGAFPGFRLRRWDPRRRNGARNQVRGVRRLAVSASKATSPGGGSSKKEPRWKPAPPQGEIAVSEDVQKWLESYNIHVPAKVGQKEASQIFHSVQAQAEVAAHRLQRVAVENPILPAGGTAFGVVIGFVLSTIWTRIKMNKHSSKKLPVSRSLAARTAGAESTEWVNMALRSVWRLYGLGLEAGLRDSLQASLDGLDLPPQVHRVECSAVALGNTPVVVSMVKRRTSRQPNFLQYQMRLRYWGPATIDIDTRVLGKGLLSLPVQVHRVDLDAEVWMRVKLAPLPPYVSEVQLAFTEPPDVRVSLRPRGWVLDLNRIPVLSDFLTNLLEVEVPAQYVLPEKLTIDVPPDAAALEALEAAGG